MTQVDNLKKQVAKVEQKGIADLIQDSAKELGKALPAHMRPERLVRIALTTLRLTPKLYECDPKSFLGALFQSAQLGLEPNVEGQAYIIPYKNQGRMMAQFQIGYKGYVELFYRHEHSLALDMQTVYENDKFDWQLGTEAYLKHRPATTDRGEVIGYYAVAKLRDGVSLFKYMTKDECMAHGRQYSKCYDRNKGTFYSSTPWATAPDQMCMKTVLMQLMKLLPKSIEIQKAVAMDETVKTEIKPDMFEVKDRMDWQDEAKDDVPEIEVEADVSEAGTSEADPDWNIECSICGTPILVTDEELKAAHAGLSKPKCEDCAGRKDEEPSEMPENIAPEGFEPSSSDLKNTPVEKLKEEIEWMALYLSGNDIHYATILLRSMSTFTTTDKKTGEKKKVEGISSVTDERLTDKWAVTIHRNIKKAYLERKAEVSGEREPGMEG